MNIIFFVYFKYDGAFKDYKIEKNIKSTISYNVNIQCFRFAEIYFDLN